MIKTRFLSRVRIVAPEDRHLDGLVRLSSAFAREHGWAGTIPIGGICSREIAHDRLLGRDVICARIAETDSGQVVGYAGVYRNEAGVDMSLLIAASHRRQGLARALVTDVFRQLPPGLCVEAWVGHFNEISLAAMPKLGFRPERTIEHDGRKATIFIRESQPTRVGKDTWD
jgi:GNAT superfamily N-acetyltransferase